VIDWKGRLANEHPLLHLLVLMAIIVVFAFIAQGLSMLIAPLMGYNLLDIASITSKEVFEPNDIQLLKWMQLIAATFSFVVPPIVFAYLISKKPWKNLGFQPKTHSLQLLLSVLSVFVITGVIAYTFQLNQNIQLPSAFSAVEDILKTMEETAERLTIAFIETDNILGLLFNIIIIGVIPAIGEELLFRGALQGSIERWTKNGHLAIWISAFIFSAIHLQFYGFFPRLILGLLLGYLFFWSRNLWIPIAVHFVNNTYQVIAYYIMKKNNPDFEMEMPSVSPWLGLGSLVGTGVLLFAFYHLSKRLNKSLI